MSNIYSIMNIGKSSILANQTVISTTSHNISNAETEGYSKQRAIFTANDPLKTYAGYVGQGTSITDIDRLNTRLIHNQMVKNQSELGYYEKSYSLATSVESVFSDATGYDIQSAITDFFNSFTKLSATPDDMALRENVRRTANIMCDRFQKTDSELLEIQTSINSELESNITEVNRLTEQIASLNAEIASLEYTGHEAGDLRDKQELLIRNLAKIIDIDTFTDSKGFVNISVDSGEAIVTGNSFNKLVLTPATNIDGFNNGIAVIKGNEQVDITDDLGEGTIGALVNMRDVTVQGYRDRMNELASGIAQQVNIIHNNATNPSGSFTLLEDPFNPGNALGGGDFFTDSDGSGIITAANISIETAITNSLSAIAVAQSSDIESVQGDNRNAIVLSKLMDTQFMSDTNYDPANGNETFLQYYQDTVSATGHDVLDFKAKASNATNESEQLSSLREEIAGVNVDEELIDLDKFKKAYEACSKIIAAADEMLQNILDLKA